MGSPMCFPAGAGNWKSRVRVLAAAAMVFLLACLAITALTGPEDYLRQFFFRRSFVQLVTLLVASLIVVLLGRRAACLARDRREWQAYRQHGEKALPAALAEQLRTVREELVQRGDAAAADCAKRIAQDGKDQLEAEYETIQVLACALPALGLLGTMLGLSTALFTAFSGEAAGPQSVRQFVAALATALDTTVLGMFCALPALATAWSLKRGESRLHAQYASLLQGSLPTVAPGPNVASPAGGPAPAVGLEPLRGELRVIAAGVLAEAKQLFQDLLADSAAVHRHQVAAAVQDVFRAQRGRERRMVVKVAALVSRRLSRSIDAAGQRVSQHNGQVAAGLIREFRQLNGALRKTVPNEVLIRYQHNGQPC